MDGPGRLFNSPEFDGPVVNGATYLLVDDTLSQGGTFAALASHIQLGGGKVIGAVASLDQLLACRHADLPRHVALPPPDNPTGNKLREATGQHE